MDSKMESERWPRRSKMGPRWAKMRPRREKMSPRNVAIAGRFAVFAKLGQFRGKEGPRMYLSVDREAVEYGKPSHSYYSMRGSMADSPRKGKQFLVEAQCLLNTV